MKCNNTKVHSLWSQQVSEWGGVDPRLEVQFILLQLEKWLQKSEELTGWDEVCECVGLDVGWLRDIKHFSLIAAPSKKYMAQRALFKPRNHGMFQRSVLHKSSKSKTSDNVPSRAHWNILCSSWDESNQWSRRIYVRISPTQNQCHI